MAAATLLVAGAVALPAGPASASPQCNDATDVYSSNVSRWMPVANGSTYRWLARGSRGPAVQALQNNLDMCYYSQLQLQLQLQRRSGEALVTDGDFGPKTEAALAYVQGLARTNADGVYGPATRNAMQWFNQSTEAGCVRYP